MNVNYGLIPEAAGGSMRSPDGRRLRGAERARARKRAASLRALADLDGWIAAQRALGEVLA
jgi:methylenetetrahydrofolate--tRNA-(uracil-5-)-methyltransferase